ncbi:hypothetical protein KAW64_16865 [bacterium]|nr:hypothetical protein [bacterium]
MIAFPLRDSTGGVSSSLAVTLSAEDVATNEPLLVCVRQGDGTDVTAHKGADRHESIELIVPRLEACVRTMDVYEQEIHASMADFVPIGAVKLSNNDARIALDYIPPVTRLAGVLAFDDGILGKISARCGELLHVVEENIDAAGDAFAMGSASKDLMSRRADYEALRTILIARTGMTNQPAALSPIRFISEVVQPLATWWIHHQGRHFRGGEIRSDGPVGTTDSLAGTLMSTSFSSLCTGSDRALRATESFLAHLTTVLQIG